MKKLEKCPLCGERGLDMAFTFYCINKECKNYKPDIQLNPSYKEEENNYNSYNWPIYDDD